MTIRLKMTLCMLCLLALLFGLGGAALVGLSFRTALEREEDLALGAYRMTLNTLRVVNSMEAWEDHGDLAAYLEQLADREDSAWAAWRLSSENEVLYEQGRAAGALANLRGQATAGQVAAVVGGDGAGGRVLQLAGTLALGEETLYLDAAYDISPIYETREEQLRIFRLIYLALVAVCAGLAYGVARLLTRQLSRLSRASRAIAAGDLAYRSGVRGGDEIGALSAEFDAMADQVEDSMRAMRAALERQERFMGSFTHELRTPMASIIGYADLLRGGTLTAEEQAEAANTIFTEARRLERLSVKLLEIFVADKQAVALAAVRPAELVRQALAAMRPRFDEKRIAARCRCEEGACLMDPDLVRSLLLNLLDNACKAVAEGGRVEVAARLTEDGCQLSVADNGRGIPPEALGHLTEAFYRVDKARARAQGGAGLGLALCARVAELHGGSLDFKSRPGQGTVALVTLRGGRAP